MIVGSGHPCNWPACDFVFESLEDLIHHVEDYHVTQDCQVTSPEGKQCTTIHLSLVNRFYTEEQLNDRRKDIHFEKGAATAESISPFTDSGIGSPTIQFSDVALTDADLEDILGAKIMGNLSSVSAVDGNSNKDLVNVGNMVVENVGVNMDGIDGATVEALKRNYASYLFDDQASLDQNGSLSNNNNGAATNPASVTTVGATNVAKASKTDKKSSSGGGSVSKKSRVTSSHHTSKSSQTGGGGNKSNSRSNMTKQMNSNKSDAKSKTVGCGGGNSSVNSKGSSGSTSISLGNIAGKSSSNSNNNSSGGGRHGSKSGGGSISKNGTLSATCNSVQQSSSVSSTNLTVKELLSKTNMSCSKNNNNNHSSVSKGGSKSVNSSGGSTNIAGADSKSSSISNKINSTITSDGTIIATVKVRGETAIVKKEPIPGKPGQMEKTYICPVPGCNKRYKNANGIKYHSLHGHGNEGISKRPYKCTFEGCGRRYKTNSGLRQHLATHEKNGDGSGGGADGANISNTDSVIQNVKSTISSMVKSLKNNNNNNNNSGSTSSNSATNTAAANVSVKSSKYSKKTSNASSSTTSSSSKSGTNKSVICNNSSKSSGGDDINSNNINTSNNNNIATINALINGGNVDSKLTTKHLLENGINSLAKNDSTSSAAFNLLLNNMAAAATGNSNNSSGNGNSIGASKKSKINPNPSTTDLTALLLANSACAPHHKNNNATSPSNSSSTLAGSNINNHNNTTTTTTTTQMGITNKKKLNLQNSVSNSIIHPPLTTNTSVSSLSAILASTNVDNKSSSLSNNTPGINLFENLMNGGDNGNNNLENGGKNAYAVAAGVNNRHIGLITGSDGDICNINVDDLLIGASNEINVTFGHYNHNPAAAAAAAATNDVNKGGRNNKNNLYKNKRASGNAIVNSSSLGTSASNFLSGLSSFGANSIISSFLTGNNHNDTINTTTPTTAGDNSLNNPLSENSILMSSSNSSTGSINFNPNTVSAADGNILLLNTVNGGELSNKSSTASPTSTVGSKSNPSPSTPLHQTTSHALAMATNAGP